MAVKYKSIETVYAQPMDYHQAGSLDLIIDYNKDKQNEDGYIVISTDRYKYWTPKQIFKDNYIKFIEGD